MFPFFENQLVACQQKRQSYHRQSEGKKCSRILLLFCATSVYVDDLIEGMQRLIGTSQARPILGTLEFAMLESVETACASPAVVEAMARGAAAGRSETAPAEFELAELVLGWEPKVMLDPV